MDTSPLQPLIRRFLDSQTTDSLIVQQSQEHRRRSEAARALLTPERIPTLTRDELAAFLQDTDAWYGVRGKQLFWRRLFGEHDERLPDLRDGLLELVRRGEAGLMAEDFNALLNALHGMGPAFLSEVLALRFPDRYWLWNGQVQTFLNRQGISLKEELPWGKKGDRGEEYMAVGRHLEDLRRAIGQAAGHVADYLLADLFIYWANRPEKAAVLPARYVTPPKISDESADGDAMGFTGFTPEAFRFLQELAANNNEHWMHKDDNANELRFRRVLREPLRALLQAVAPRVKQLSPIFETEVKFGKVLAGIKKRWPDETGPYHTHLWGAFYRAGRSKQTDAQLFVIIHPDHVNVGFSVAGSQGADVIGRFRRNLQQAPDIFLRLLAALPEDVHIALAERHGMAKKTIVRERGESLLKVLQEAGLIDIERRYPADAPILTRPEFADEVALLFTRLYPLYQFAISDDPQTLLPLEETEEEETTEPPIQRYTFDRLCAETYLDDEFWRQVEGLLQHKRQIIFYGPPGTGKTFLARCLARYWVEAAPDPRGDVRVLQFHPSYAYEDFVEGIRPQSIETKDGRRELDYPVKKGVFRRFCEETQDNPRRRYVLILDEINRGELPRIFGELLYLLEYRAESVFLPYSGEQFAIPANLYLIGTMNTADRSIALVDHALRRRFHLVALKPSPEVLRTYLEGNGSPDMAWLADLLELVNQRLNQDGIEWHLHIGHSHFMRADMDESALRLVWEHSVLPTLEEYFYRQPDRLRAYRLSDLKAALGRA